MARDYVRISKHWLQASFAFLGPNNVRIAVFAIAAIPTPDVGLLVVNTTAPYAGPGKRSDPLCQPHRRIRDIALP